MDTELITIFPDANSEGSCSPFLPCVRPGLQTDLTDSPISQMSVVNDSSVYITDSVGFGSSGQFAYLSNWQRVVNNERVGIPNYFTWLDAYSPNPLVPGTVRQAFARDTRSLNPYVASTAHDFYVVGNIYDSLAILNPLDDRQLIDWVALSSSQTPLSNAQLPYAPPVGTAGTYRFTLRNDIFFQDGRKLTAFDVAFSYLSLKANGALQAQGASAMTGITVLGPNQLDISVSNTTFATKINLTSLTILPGRYWTSVGASPWDSVISQCLQPNSLCSLAQYTLGPTPPTGAPLVQCAIVCVFPAAFMNADPGKTDPVYDPISHLSLVGSGPWGCGLVTSVGSGVCSTSGQENPPIGGGYTLTRFGKGVAPASTVTGDYFRSSGNLALWIWSGDDGDITHDFLNFSRVANCFGNTIGTPPCVHYQQGIGGNDANGVPQPVRLTQLSIVLRFVGVAWVSPFFWQSANTPTGIAPLVPSPPILYAGSVVLNPASVVGCPLGYDC